MVGSPTMSATLPIETEGKLWKPKPDATATINDFIAARATFRRLNAEAIWNPWVLEDQADDMEAAMAVMEQWTRAELGFRRLTAKQLEARCARDDRRREAERAKLAARQEAARSRYNADLETARLSLLEETACLREVVGDLAGHQDGTLFPAMPADRRADEVTKLEGEERALRAELARLSSLVGDPEIVVDKLGRLPGDRRELTLMMFSARRSTDVRRPRIERAERQAALDATTDRKERSERRRELQDTQRRLAEWLAIPPLTAEDMCSECATPTTMHGWRIDRTRRSVPSLAALVRSDAEGARDDGRDDQAGPTVRSAATTEA